MIEAIRLFNFQCHKKLTIKLSPTITTIVGSSDIGKSAVLRALRWVCLGKPSGESFVSHGAKKATVQIKVDGKIIKRSTSPREYKLGAKSFRAFRNDVPPEVADVLGLCDTNFQTQHDAPFWFSLTPGQVSKALNSIVDLSSIDVALADVGSRVRKAGVVSDVCQQRLATAQENKQKLLWAKQANAQLKKLERMEAKLAQERTTLATMGSLIGKAEQNTTASKRAAKRLVGAKRVLTVGMRLEKALRASKELDDLLASTISLQHKTRVPPPDIQELETAARKLDHLAELIRECDFFENARQEVHSELLAAETKLANILKGRCPLCHRQ